jgi:hypothetical protein
MTDGDPMATAPGDLHSPVHWPSVLPEDAETAWAELRDWVERLVDRYALDARVVPPCWFRHNGHVEALLALRDAERACFDPSTPPSGGMDWFRALWEIEHRLLEWSARTQCSTNDHRPDPHPTWRIDEEEWDRFVADDVASRAEHAPEGWIDDP